MIATTLGVTHTFWNIAGTPLQSPDSFWGYARSINTFIPYISLWLLVSLTLILFAIGLTHRGARYDCLPLSKLSKVCWLSVGITLCYGSALHLQIADERPLYNSHKREQWKADYEKQYREWALSPQPTIISLNSEVNIYPHKGYADFKIEYVLKNNTLKPIHKILVGGYGNSAKPMINQKQIKLIKLDNELNQGIYQFTTPLLPNETRNIMVRLSFNQPKLWPSKFHQVVKPEFTYLRSVPLLPQIGYQPRLQLQNTELRMSYGLQPLTVNKPSEFSRKPANRDSKYGWVTLKSTVSTSSDHTAITQGQLVKQWAEQGRNVFQYQTTSPIRNIPTWVSVPFQAKTKQSNGIEFNVFTPTQGDAATVNLKAMDDTVRWISKNIAPYRYSKLHLIATPEFGATGYALPNIMFISHKVGFRSKPSSKVNFDQRYRRAVHETAHQWFGHDIGNGIDKDRAFLIESMAKYVELVMLEHHYGEESMQALVEYQ